MSRCHQTLSSLRDRLGNGGSKEYALHYNEPWKISQEDRRLSTAGTAISTLRAHVNLYTQTLQMSLQAINLVHQKRNKTSPESLQAHIQSLSTAFQDLKVILSRRTSIIDRDSQDKVFLDDGLLTDVERCLKTAQNIVQGRSAPLSPIATPPPAVYELPDNALPRSPKVSVSTTVTAVEEDVSSSERRPRLNSLEIMPLRIRKQPSLPTPSSGTGYATGRDPFDDANAKKHQGSPDSEDDPEPNFQDGFPPAVYAELISTLRLEVDREMKAGNWEKAEEAHRKAIRYCVDRERDLHIPFEDRNQMEDTLVDIYIRQKQFDLAKGVLSSLLKQEGDTERKWMLYHTLAKVYLDQNRLPEAEKFAKRAYIGREKMLGKGHGLILLSAGLLVQIYEQQGEMETAQAFRNLYDSGVQRNHPPQIAKHIGTRRVKWNPDLSVDINAPTKSGETPLITAVTCGDDEMLHRVLKSGADVEIRGPDDVTPLMHAISHGHEKIAGVLLSRGAQVDAPTSGWTPLHKACDMGHLLLIALLLANHANIEAKSPKRLIIKKKLIPLGPKPTPRPLTDDEDDDDDDSEASDSTQGWTPLLRAARTGKEPVVRLLLDKHANIEARSPSKATPLICAAEARHDAIVDLLLSRGADVEAQDDFGWRPLHRTLVIGKGGEQVAQMLIDNDADINAACVYKKTPLHHAIEKNNAEMACFLMRNGADVEARDIALRTPLHLAVECRLENMVYILLEFGADSGARDKSGRDALGAANHTMRKSPEIVKLLGKHNKRSMSLSAGGGDGRRESSALSTASTVVSSYSGGGGPPTSPVTTPTTGSSGGGAGWWSRRKSKRDKR